MSKFKHFTDKPNDVALDFVPLKCYQKDFNFIVFVFTVIVFFSLHTLWTVYDNIYTLKDRINKIEQKMLQGELILTSIDSSV